MDNAPDQAPNFGPRTTYPNGGRFIGPAWRAMWELLADGRPRRVAELLVVCDDVVEKTVVTLLSTAANRDILTRVYAWHGSRRKAFYSRPAESRTQKLT